MSRIFETFGPFSGHFEALFQDKTATDFQKGYSITLFLLKFVVLLTKKVDEISKKRILEQFFYFSTSLGNFEIIFVWKNTTFFFWDVRHSV